MRFRYRILATLKPLAAGFAAMLLAQSPLLGETISVCPVGCDASSFQGAINLASAGDTVELQTTAPHTEAGIVVTKSLTIQGVEGVGGVIQADSVPGTAPTRVMTVPAGVTVVLRDLDIRYGVEVDGGGILNHGNLTLERVGILDNQAEDGGGIRNIGILHIVDSSFSGNTTTGFGGGIYNDMEAFAVVERTSFLGNGAGLGGGLCNLGGLLITQSILDSNGASWGGGVYNLGGELVIEQTSLEANQVSLGGGGARIFSGTIEISDSRIKSNFSQGSGGGISIGNDVSRAEVSNTAFSFNSTFGDGGALYTQSATTPLLDNVTMAFNDAHEDGGAIYVYGGTGIKLASATIAFNTADLDQDNDGDGGGLRLGGECDAPICALSWATMKNTLIADNQDDSPVGTVYHDCLGKLTSEGFNLVGDGGTDPFSSCRVVGDLTGVMTSVAAGLDNLADHGGPTTWNGGRVPRTVSLLSGSLARDAGNPSGCREWENNPLSLDQRHAPRVGNCDIGAFEFDGVPAPPTPLFSDGFESGSLFFWSATSQ